MTLNSSLAARTKEASENVALCIKWTDFTLLKLSQVGHSRSSTIILAGKLGVIWLYEALFKKQQKALAPQNQFQKFVLISQGKDAWEDTARQGNKPPGVLRWGTENYKKVRHCFQCSML